MTDKANDNTIVQLYKWNRLSSYLRLREIKNKSKLASTQIIDSIWLFLEFPDNRYIPAFKFAMNSDLKLKALEAK